MTNHHSVSDYKVKSFQKEMFQMQYHCELAP